MSRGLNLTGQLAFSAVIGFGGSLFSLFMSKRMALWSTHARVVETPANEVESWLVDTVARQAQASDIGMPMWPCTTAPSRTRSRPARAEPMRSSP